MRRLFPLASLLVLLGACACESNRTAPAPSAQAEAETPRVEALPPTTRAWTFDDARPGELPPGFHSAETNGVGTPATWTVVADPSASTLPHAFGVTASRNTKKTYNLAWVDGTRYGDVDLQVMLRADSGQLNRGGGLVWRVKGELDYYLARWDPLEDNAYLYIVQGGARTALAKVDLELDHESWHALRVVAQGSRIEFFIDDRPVLTAEDSSLPGPGMIGLWTKSDAVTRFDDLSAAAP